MTTPQLYLEQAASFPVNRSGLCNGILGGVSSLLSLFSFMLLIFDHKAYLRDAACMNFKWHFAASCACVAHAADYKTGVTVSVLCTTLVVICEETPALGQGYHTTVKRLVTAITPS